MPREMVDLNDMVVFARVAELGSFTGAARELAMPKSTVSRKVAALEDQLGVRLLQRTTRKLSLTDVGAAYAERCVAIRSEAEEANLSVTNASESPRGTLRLTVPIEVGRRYLGPLFAEYASRFPEVQIDVSLSDRVVDIVAEGYDLAIRVGRLEDSSLIARQLGPTQQIVCASRAYLKKRGEPQTPDELASHDLVSFSSSRGGDVWRLLGPDGEIAVPVEPRIIANDFELVAKLVCAGRGIAKLPSWVAFEPLRCGDIVPILENYAPAEVGIYAVYPTRRHLSAKVRTFLELLLERMSPPPWAEDPSAKA